MPGKFEMYKDKAGKFRWRLKHPGGMVAVKSGRNYPAEVKTFKGLWIAAAAANSG